jgi:poly(3-hydroxybutyrate) depolymerase
MYIYVPDKLAANPPILVLLHYWGGGASGVFAEAAGGGIVAAADEYGFIMVPQSQIAGTQARRSPSRTTVAVTVKVSPRW